MLQCKKNLETQIKVNRLSPEMIYQKNNKYVVLFFKNQSSRLLKGQELINLLGSVLRHRLMHSEVQCGLHNTVELCDTEK